MVTTSRAFCGERAARGCPSIGSLDPLGDHRRALEPGERLGRGLADGRVGRLEPRLEIADRVLRVEGGERLGDGGRDVDLGHRLLRELTDLRDLGLVAELRARGGGGGGEHRISGEQLGAHLLLRGGALELAQQLDHGELHLAVGVEHVGARPRRSPSTGSIGLFASLAASCSACSPSCRRRGSSTRPCPQLITSVRVPLMRSIAAARRQSSLPASRADLLIRRGLRGVRAGCAANAAAPCPWRAGPAGRARAAAGHRRRCHRAPGAPPGRRDRPARRAPGTRPTCTSRQLRERAGGLDHHAVVGIVEQALEGHRVDVGAHVAERPWRTGRGSRGVVAGADEQVGPRQVLLRLQQRVRATEASARWGSPSSAAAPGRRTCAGAAPPSSARPRPGRARRGPARHRRRLSRSVRRSTSGGRGDPAHRLEHRQLHRAVGLGGLLLEQGVGEAGLHVVGQRRPGQPENADGEGRLAAHAGIGIGEALGQRAGGVGILNAGQREEGALAQQRIALADRASASGGRRPGSGDLRDRRSPACRCAAGSAAAVARPCRAGGLGLTARSRWHNRRAEERRRGADDAWRPCRNPTPACRVQSGCDRLECARR